MAASRGTPPASRDSEGQADAKGPDPIGRALELILALALGLMGARITWRGLAEGMDAERILGGGVMLAAALALGTHAIRRGRKPKAPTHA